MLRKYHTFSEFSYVDLPENLRKVPRSANVNGKSLLDIFMRDYDTFISIEGHSLYPNKGKSGG